MIQPRRRGLHGLDEVSLIAGGAASNGGAMGEGADNLVIFGASARAAAFSALRAGLAPWCADLFADADLRARCPAMRLPGRYPQGFLDLVDAPVPGPWMYTGGLENWPALVGQMAERRPLWGNGPSALVRARDPEFLAGTAHAAGLPAPKVARGVHRPPEGRWLVKPLRGSGGIGVRFFKQLDEAGAGLYLQEFIEGESASAVFAGDGTGARLLGVTRQLVGAGWLNAGPFRYCGSVGPLPLGRGLQRSLEEFGRLLARRAGLRGLFGVDGVLRGSAFWPV